MAFFDSHLLSIMVFAPLLLGILGLLVPAAGARWSALIASMVTFAVSVMVYLRYDPAGAEFQLMEKYEWIPSMGIHYLLGTDGISLWLVLLTTFLMPIVIFGAFKAVEQREKEFYFFLLALESGILGAFVALDLFLFYVFWEAMLVPMYFLIGICN
jgi:NADH-quinone oxidoreductase subunit M